MVAEIRLENPSSSLKEIADLFSESIGKPVSKSMINHVMRSLHRLFLKLGGQDNE